MAQQMYDQVNEGKTTAEPREEKHRDKRDDDIRDRITGYVKSRLSDQIILSGVKMRKAAGALKNTANCFNEEDQRLIGEYVIKAADRIDKFSIYLQDTPLDRIKENARELSLKRPWLFMGACFSTGIVLARIVKASQDRS